MSGWKRRFGLEILSENIYERIIERASEIEPLGIQNESFADMLFRGRILSVTANQGHGKTWLMTALAKDAQLAGIEVYSDFHIKGINCSEILFGKPSLDYPSNDHFISSFSDIKERTFPSGSLLLLDELIREFDNRLTMFDREETKKRAKLTQAIMQTRKKGLKLVHSEQLTKSIDWRFTFLSEVFLIPRPTAIKKTLDGRDFINVEFEIKPILNLGLFGFDDSLPEYIVDENYFWSHAFNFDSLEYVYSEEEKQIEIEKRKKIKDEGITQEIPEERRDPFPKLETDL